MTDQSDERGVAFIPTRATLVERRRAVRAEIEQIFIDAEYWNHLHPDEPPIDPDPNGELRRAAKGIDDAIAIEEQNK